MALLLEKMKDSYNFLFYELADERSRDMFPSGLMLMCILSFYLYFTKTLGPRLMADMKPFKLRTTIYYYNLFQIFICLYILHLGFKGGWLNGYVFSCQPVDYTENPQSIHMLTAVWWYTTVKFIDLLDTVFFVLRKKDKQISFLHVFHHTIMPIASFISLKYYPNGHATLVGFVNCIVHIVMYTYYLIAGLGPKYKKYLWWKKYLTIMQLVQFGIILIHNLIALCDSTCAYPKWISALLCLNSSNFVYLFGRFYYFEYIKKPRITENATAKPSSKQSKIE